MTASLGSRSYLTVATGARPEAVVEAKRSRFIATLARAKGAGEARAVAAEVAAENRDARHHVVAWVLASGEVWSTDDGEPRGTGGHPVLDVLRTAELADVVCVVTRYFGGTLLGAGGLVRAYAGAAKEALAAARARGQLVRVTLGVEVWADIPYALHDRVVALAESSGGTLVERLFAEDVTCHFQFPLGAEEPFLGAMGELAAGEELCRVGEPRYLELPSA